MYLWSINQLDALLKKIRKNSNIFKTAAKKTRLPLSKQKKLWENIVYHIKCNKYYTLLTVQLSTWWMQQRQESFYFWHSCNLPHKAMKPQRKSWAAQTPWPFSPYFFHFHLHHFIASFSSAPSFLLPFSLVSSLIITIVKFRNNPASKYYWNMNKEFVPKYSVFPLP